jgi:hypothetical protein
MYKSGSSQGGVINDYGFYGPYLTLNFADASNEFDVSGAFHFHLEGAIEYV